jgi:deoxyadenosine/deoxycytidine kinase
MLLPNMQHLETVVSIQGNIGAGKTTFMADFERRLANASSMNIISVNEPVNEWRVNRYRNGTKSILDLFYEDTNKNAFLFQVNAFNTRQQAVINAMSTIDIKDKQVILLSERSMISDKLFCENLFRQGTISEEEWDVYNKFYQTVTSTLVKLEKVMIYLDVGYQTCYSRLVKRSRNEEMKIPIEYLKSLEEMHEEMLLKFAAEPGNIIIRIPWVESEPQSTERTNIINDVFNRLEVFVSS